MNQESGEAAEQKIRIVVADDSDFVRRAVCALLLEQADFEIAGEARNGYEAVTRVKDLRPEVAVLDVSMPEMNGIEAATVINEALPQTRIIFLTEHAPTANATLAEFPGCVFIPKSQAKAKLIEAIRGSFTAARKS